MNKKLLTLTLLLSGINAVSLGQKQLVRKLPDTKKEKDIIDSKKITAIKYAQAELNSTSANEIDEFGVEWSGKNVVDVPDKCHFDLLFGPTSSKLWSDAGWRFTKEIESLSNWLAKALITTDDLYGINAREGAADAFLHCYFIAGITYSFGSDLAEDFITFYNGTYVGTDMTELNRATMDIHNNTAAVGLGVNFKAYEGSMTGTIYEKLAKYISHVIKNGKYYDIIQLNGSGLGFINTTQGVQDPMFPPFC